MPRDTTVDFVWISLAILFFALAGFHTYLAETAVLEIKVPETVYSSTGSSAESENSRVLMNAISREVGWIINAFVVAYK